MTQALIGGYALCIILSWYLLILVLRKGRETRQITIPVNGSEPAVAFLFACFWPFVWGFIITALLARLIIFSVTWTMEQIKWWLIPPFGFLFALALLLSSCTPIAYNLYAELPCNTYQSFDRNYSTRRTQMRMKKQKNYSLSQWRGKRKF